MLRRGRLTNVRRPLREGSRKDAVGEAGFEPATSCSQSRCAARLRYSPVSWWRSAAGQKPFSGRLCRLVLLPAAFVPQPPGALEGTEAEPDKRSQWRRVEASGSAPGHGAPRIGVQQGREVPVPEAGSGGTRRGDLGRLWTGSSDLSESRCALAAESRLVGSLVRGAVRPAVA